MSLLDAFMTKCNILDKTTTADGLGGYITTWKKGAEFTAAITLDTSIQGKIAEKQGDVRKIKGQEVAPPALVPDAAGFSPCVTTPERVEI